MTKEKFGEKSFFYYLRDKIGEMLDYDRVSDIEIELTPELGAELISHPDIFRYAYFEHPERITFMECRVLVGDKFEIRPSYA